MKDWEKRNQADLSAILHLVGWARNVTAHCVVFQLIPLELRLEEDQSHQLRDPPDQPGGGKVNF